MHSASFSFQVSSLKFYGSEMIPTGQNSAAHSTNVLALLYTPNTHHTGQRNLSCTTQYCSLKKNTSIVDLIISLVQQFYELFPSKTFTLQCLTDESAVNMWPADVFKTYRRRKCKSNSSWIEFWRNDGHALIHDPGAGSEIQCLGPDSCVNKVSRRRLSIREKS